MSRLPYDRAVGVCAVGLIATDPPRRKRSDLCPAHEHPGVTYNPSQDRTWCLCGDVTRDGNQATHADCCGGPLSGESR